MLLLHVIVRKEQKTNRYIKETEISMYVTGMDIKHNIEKRAVAGINENSLLANQLDRMEYLENT